jgi:hypothetical protein
VLIALASFFFSMYEAYEGSKERKALQRPHAFVSFEFNHEGSGFYFHSWGPGDAYVKWALVTVDGEEAPTWEDVLLTLGVEVSDFEVLMLDRVWSPAESKRIFWARAGALDRFLRTQAHRITVQTCFCGVQDDCWASTQYSELRIRPVESCDPRPQNHLRLRPVTMSHPAR